MGEAIKITANMGRAGGDPGAYRIAGGTVVSDVPIEHLEPWSIPMVELPNPGAEADSRLSGAKLVYEGEGSFYAGSQRVSCYQLGARVRIDLDDRPIALADLESAEITCLEPRGLEDPIVHEVLLGPALMLILACRGTWCFHAGAALVADRVVAFCAESGLGKSTLATDSRGWLRVADDILPMHVDQHGVLARPEFPQLKLDAASQYVDAGNQSLPLGAVFRILPEGEQQDVTVTRLPAGDSVMQLVRHTVSSRLFAPGMLRDHMQAMQYLVEQVPVYELAYPREISILDEVREAVRATISGYEDSP